MAGSIFEDPRCPDLTDVQAPPSPTSRVTFCDHRPHITVQTRACKPAEITASHSVMMWELSRKAPLEDK